MVVSVGLEVAMPEESLDPVASIGALAEPVRRALYRFVADQPGPVGREEAAAGVGVAVHSAKFHLDRLVDEGLLVVEFRRLSGRSGPGAGRPAKLYRRSAVEVSVSLPERRYALAGHLLAGAVDRTRHRGVPLEDAVRETAHLAGRQAGEQAGARTDDRTDDAEPLGHAVEVLAGAGYEPRAAEDEVVLANCPFHELARAHTDLVCGLNQAYVAGLLEGLGCTTLSAVLDPRPGLCCVRVRPAAGDRHPPAARA
jgi:predicted ArsR family transcriptional regulator